MMQPNLKAEGYKHGRNGWEIARPDCADYMDGYNAGNKGYLVELEALRPFDTMTPCGTSDAHADQFSQ